MTEVTKPPSARQVAHRLNKLRATPLHKPKAVKAHHRRSVRKPKSYAETSTINDFNITKGDVARFIFMPQIAMSLKSVGFSLAVINQTFASILIAFRLLPNDHPAQLISNARKYSVIKLLGEARRNLYWEREAIPQWIIFGSICGFIVSFSTTLVLMLAKFGLGVAFADDGSGSGAVINGSMLAGSEDLAGNILNSIFNLNGGSTTMPGINLMLQMYSNTMLVFAGVILLWIIISTVADTARTGVPFGKHFNPVWAPIRLVVAIGMLVPLGSGLNSGQHIVLALTKWGSSQATTIWTTFAGKIDAGQGGIVSNGSVSKGNYDTMVVHELVSQMANEVTRRAGLALAEPGATNAPKPIVCEETVTKLAVRSAKSSDVADITINRQNAIGVDSPGNLNCGSVSYTTTNNLASKFTNGAAPPNVLLSSALPTNANPADVSEAVLADQYDSTRWLRNRIATVYPNLIKDVVDAASQYDEHGAKNPVYGQMLSTYGSTDAYQNQLAQLQEDFWQQQLSTTSTRLDQYNTKLADEIKKEMSKTGWVAAPIWINAIARENARFMNAQGSFPVFHPPSFPASDSDSHVGVDFARALQVFKYEAPDVPKQLSLASSTANGQAPSAGVLAGIFLNEGQPMENPLAHLTTVGRYTMRISEKLSGMADKNLTGTGSESIPILETAAGAASKHVADMSQLSRNVDLAASGSLAEKEAQKALMVAERADQTKMLKIPLLTFGFLMGYLLPLMLFFRFILGVLGWLLLVFEALLAMPLFALAHLKTDGEGFMSQMAQSGYIMILGLIIRPILMIIGLVVGLICFNAIAQLTNVLFTYAITNTAAGASGSGGNVNIFDFKNGVSGDFMSLGINMMLYATFMITLANSAFKAVDLIPNHVMGWLGSRMDQRTEDAGVVQQTVLGSVTGGAMMGGNLGMAAAIKQGGGLSGKGAQQGTSDKDPSSVG